MKPAPRLIAFLCIALTAVSAAGFETTLTLEEHLGHAWPAELVHRRVEVASQGQAFAGRLALFDGDTCIPMQLDDIEVYPDGSIRAADVWFRSDLPANGTREYVLRDTGDAPVPEGARSTDLQIVESGNVLELRNSATAVRLAWGSWDAGEGAAASPAEHIGQAAPAEGAPGPLLGVRLPSGAWTAPSRIIPHGSFSHDIDLVQPVDPEGPAGAVLGYTSETLAQGPIFVRGRVTYRFAGDGHYAMTVTVRAGEPLVRIDEEYERAGALVLDLGADFAPTSTLYETYRQTEAGRVEPIAYGESHKVALFVGWDFFFKGLSPAFAFDGDPKGDLLGLVSTDPDWLPYPYNQGLHVFAGPGPSFEARASLGRGHRHWAFYVGRRADFGGSAKAFIGWWHHAVALPLDKVANWQLVWPGMDDLTFPHTFFDRTELTALRTRLQEAPEIRDFVSRLKPKIFTEAGAALLVSGDASHLTILSDPGARYVDGFPALFLAGNGYWDESYLSYMQVTDELLQRYVGLELLLGRPETDPQLRRGLLTRLAFMQYLMDDHMYWPPNYDFSPQKEERYPAYVQGTPNQKICYVTARGIVAAMLRNHPEFDRWMDRVLEEFDRVASGSVAPSGAHLESPFYSSRDTMRFGPFWTALTRAGVQGPVVDRWTVRLKRCYEYLGDMLTPPEPRMGGRRVYHPIGRSSPGVVDPTMMIGADPFGRDDPEHARRMRWCWEAQGRPAPDIMGTTGGRDMSLTMLAALQTLAAEPLDTPPLRSRRWEGMGAIFRSQVGTDHESNVIFRHDPFCWNLYEGNNGAVYVYGKGAPLLARFGAYWAQQQGMPNLMSVPFGNRVVFAEGDTTEQWVNGLGNMTDYASLGALADYAGGVTRDGHWRRQVLFAKDLGRDDPVYLFVRDDVSRPRSKSALHWWVMSKQVQPDGLDKPGVVPFKGKDEEWMANIGKNWQGAPDMKGQFHHFEGQCGVDLDMFIARPAEPVIVTDAVGVGPGMPYCVNLKLHEHQQLVRIEQPAGKGYTTLFQPRWPGSGAPSYRTIADGAGVVVEGGGRTDTLFLGDDTIRYADGGVQFEGKVGFVRSGGPTPLRLMVMGGSVSAGGVTLKSAEPVAAQLEGGELLVWCASRTDDVEVELAPELAGARVRFRREEASGE